LSTKCASEKSLKISQYLTKIWTITKWDVFFFETQCSKDLLSATSTVSFPLQQLIFLLMLMATVGHSFSIPLKVGG